MSAEGWNPPRTSVHGGPLTADEARDLDNIALSEARALHEIFLIETIARNNPESDDGQRAADDAKDRIARVAAGTRVAMYAGALPEPEEDAGAADGRATELFKNILTGCRHDKRYPCGRCMFDALIAADAAGFARGRAGR